MSTSYVQKKFVTCDGNAWIMCRSKTYGGRVYYFNTETGESLWNLSQPEIIMAKRRTHFLEKQSAFNTDDYPEPTYCPYDNFRQVYQGANNKNHKIHVTKVYNQQAKNNHFTETFPVNCFSNNNSFSCNQFNSIVSPTFNRISNLVQQTSFVNQSPVHAIPALFNVNSEPLLNCFNNISNTQSAKQNKIREFKRNINLRQNKHFNTKFQRNRKNVDLRWHYEKSNINKNKSFHQSGPARHFRKTNSFNRNKNGRNNIFNMLNDDDDMWLEENLQSRGKGETLDLIQIKKKLQIKRFDIWYIVVDSDTLLNNINFINILTNSDHQCRLVVPKAVMDNIEKTSNSRLKTQARRVEYFISQQIKAAMAIIDEVRIPGAFDERCSIIMCCTKLIQDNCPVIILSNDLEFNNIRVDKVTVFTIKEMKGLLSKTLHENKEAVEPEQKTLYRNSIKITFPNKETFKNNVDYQTAIYNNIRIQPNSERIVSENKNTDPIDNIRLRPNTSTLECRAKQKFCGDRKPGVTEKKEFKWNRRRTDSCSTEDSVSDLDIDFPVDIDYTDSNISVNDSETSTKSFEIACGKEGDVNRSSISESTQKEYTHRENGCDIEESDSVMFEVTNKTMEDYLRTKSDELVSRFKQIMEKVLEQILRQEPSSIMNAMPPSWNIYEGIQCVKKKFYFDADVVTASIKLVNVLKDLGGLRENIKNNISPHKYMEMYSFGVYLIDALQGVLTDSEVLQTASKSLSILLKDIQNPFNQESFVDLDGNGLSDETEQPHSTVEDNYLKTSGTKYIDQKCTERLKQNNLQCHSKTHLQEEEENSFIQPVHSESSFSSRLELRNSFPSTSKNHNNDTQTKDQDYTNGDCDSFTDVHGNNDTVTPKIVRKFVKLMEFEEKMKRNSELPSNSSTRNNENDKEELDYEDYDSDNSSDNSSDGSQDFDKLQTGKKNCANDFELYLNTMENYAKVTYIEVNKFCKNSYQKLSSTPSDSERCNIMEMSEKSYSTMDKLCKALTGMLERDKNSPEFKKLLKITEFNDVVVLESKIKEYRRVVGYLLKHGNILKNMLNLISHACKMDT